MEYAVSVRELTKKFGDFVAVDRLTINIRPGEICGFLGPNGAGKSTVVRMLCGILEPTAGEATILGYDLKRETDKVKQKIGYMSQKFSLYDDLTVRENLEFYAGMYSVPARERGRRIGEMLDLAGLGQRQRDLVANLSVGWKQRLALACALISKPSLVFLDEPTSGVSPTSRRDFFNIIQGLASQGTTVIVTTHFMDEAERCGRIAFISAGRLIAFDTPDYLKNNTLKGCLTEVRMPQAIQRMKDIAKLPYVLECSLHGPVLHVLLRGPEDMESLRHYTGGKVEPITPSLEDVFIALAKNNVRQVTA